MGLFDAFTSKTPVLKEVVNAPLVNPWPVGSAQATAWDSKTDKQQRWLGGADPTDPYIAARMNSDLGTVAKKAAAGLAVPTSISGAAAKLGFNLDETKMDTGNLMGAVSKQAGVDGSAKGVVAPSISEDSGVNGYAVRLIAVRNFPAESVIFRVTPTFSESRAVDYAQVTPVHMPGSIQVYRRTGSRTFSIGAKFVSRNRAQATENMQYLQLLRGWTMPYFGERDYKSGGGTEQIAPGGQTAKSEYKNSMLGAPPDVLYLYAYSSTVGDSSDRTGGTNGRVNIKKVPVVITNLNVTYPDDVDYIPVEGTNEPFPVKMEVTVELIETHSPVGYEQFSLSMFKKGELVQF